MNGRWSGLLLGLAVSAACAAGNANPATGGRRAGTAAASTPAPGPGVRNAHGLAFDGRRVVLFGGASDRAVVGDTWGWNGERWQLLTATGPPPRTFPAMAGDAGGHRVYLFGGSKVLFGTEPGVAELLDDFWIWDGQGWTSWTGPRPPARAEASAAWDAGRARFVVFGGYTFDGRERRRLGDTWEFDGAAWQQTASDGPSPRSGAVMTHDGSNRRTLLFGGSGRRHDTWSWDGRVWTDVSGAAVPPRYNAAMTWDAAAGRVLRFGGWNGEARTADSWAWKDSAWTELAMSGPPARNHSGLAFDSRRGCAGYSWEATTATT